MLTENLETGLSVVVPVYNGARSLPELVTRLAQVLPGLAADYEVILVNDGSADESWEVIGRLAAQHPWVRGIGMLRNYGQHNALLAGVRAARYDVTATLDDDLQHPPEEFPKLFAALGPHIDVVYGAPAGEPHGFARGLASRITKFSLRHALGAETAGSVSAFRVFRTHLRRGFRDFHSPFVSLDVLLTWSTKRFSAVCVPHVARRHGASNYSFFRLLQHAATLMTGFSVWPLQLASLLGFASALAGLGILFYVLGRYLLEDAQVPGFPFLASLIAIFAGVQMFALGIIGEYLARMHFRLLDRPAYVVAEQVNDPGPA